MLIEISIRNFAVISSLTVSFREGLHVLTGETGAGKSVIIDAVSLLVGGRASSEYVRHGANKAEIEGLFQVPDQHPAYALLADLGIEAEDEMIILRRDVSTQGKSVCRVNGKLVTLAILRELGQVLVDIHGQHEHQRLLNEEHYLHLLDSYGRKEIEKQRQEYHNLYRQYKQLHQALKQLTEGEQQLVQRLDLLRYQLQEIAAAQLEPEEDERLEKEKRKYTHAQKIFSGVHEAYNALQAEAGALDALGVALHQLQELSELDDTLKASAETVETAFYQLEDVAQLLTRYKDEVEFDPMRLNVIESRLMQLDQLKRKYGQSVEDILEYAARIEDELDSIEHKDERIKELERRLNDLLMDLAVEAKHLTRVRQSVAKRLVQDIKRELGDLHMDKTVIELRLVPASSGEKVEIDGQPQMIRSDGWDELEFLISPNPGEPPKPLAKIASGGELSRLMLALKTVFAKNEPVNTLIFDEVDTGVSGRVAQAMAEKLYRISNGKQVLCITHHSQVAAMADEHYRIEKQQTKQETKTVITALKHHERSEELAWMMSGAEVTDVTLQHANELLSTARAIREGIKGRKQKENVNK
jgi:DNA repair protein RecN (Recombination protein N)